MEDLVAAFAQFAFDRRHERMCDNQAGKRNAARPFGKFKLKSAIFLLQASCQDRIAKARGLRAIHPQAIEIDIGHCEVIVPSKAFGFGKQGSVLGNQGVAAENQVRAGLPRSGGRVHVTRQAPGRLLHDERTPIIRLRNRLVARGEIQTHGRAVKGLERTRGHGAPHVFADLYANHAACHVRATKEQIRSKGNRLAEQLHDVTDNSRSRCKEACVVKFLVRRQIRLGNDAQHFTAMHDGSAIEDLIVDD